VVGTGQTRHPPRQPHPVAPAHGTPDAPRGGDAINEPSTPTHPPPCTTPETPTVILGTPVPLPTTSPASSTLTAASLTSAVDLDGTTESLDAHLYMLETPYMEALSWQERLSRDSKAWMVEERTLDALTIPMNILLNELPRRDHVAR
jgi:hypothetical protein